MTFGIRATNPPPVSTSGPDLRSPKMTWEEQQVEFPHGKAYHILVVGACESEDKAYKVCIEMSKPNLKEDLKAYNILVVGACESEDKAYKVFDEMSQPNLEEDLLDIEGTKAVHHVFDEMPQLTLANENEGKPYRFPTVVPNNDGIDIMGTIGSVDDKSPMYLKSRDQQLKVLDPWIESETKHSIVEEIGNRCLANTIEETYIDYGSTKEGTTIKHIAWGQHELEPPPIYELVEEANQPFSWKLVSWKTTQHLSSRMPMPMPILVFGIDGGMILISSPNNYHSILVKARVCFSDLYYHIEDNLIYVVFGRYENGVFLVDKDTLFLFDPGGCTLSQMACESSELFREQGGLCLAINVIDALIKAISNKLWIWDAYGCGIEIEYPGTEKIDREGRKIESARIDRVGEMSRMYRFFSTSGRTDQQQNEFLLQSESNPEIVAGIPRTTCIDNSSIDTVNHECHGCEHMIYNHPIAKFGCYLFDGGGSFLNATAIRFLLCIKKEIVLPTQPTTTREDIFMLITSSSFLEWLKRKACEVSFTVDAFDDADKSIEWTVFKFFLIRGYSDIYVTTAGLHALAYTEHLLYAWLGSNSFGYQNIVVQGVIHKIIQCCDCFEPSQVFTRRCCDIEFLIVGLNKERLHYSALIFGTETVRQSVMKQLHKLVNLKMVEEILMKFLEGSETEKYKKSRALFVIDIKQLVAICAHRLKTIARVEETRENLFEGVVNAKLQNFIWDPGYRIMYFYILEDKDVLKRNGIGVRMALKLDEGLNGAVAYYNAHMEFLACSLFDLEQNAIGIQEDEGLSKCLNDQAPLNFTLSRLTLRRCGMIQLKLFATCYSISQNAEAVGVKLSLGVKVSLINTNDFYCESSLLHRYNLDHSSDGTVTFLNISATSYNDEQHGLLIGERSYVHEEIIFMNFEFYNKNYLKLLSRYQREEMHGPELYLAVGPNLRTLVVLNPYEGFDEEKGRNGIKWCSIWCLKFFFSCILEDKDALKGKEMS